MIKAFLRAVLAGTLAGTAVPATVLAVVMPASGAFTPLSLLDAFSGFVTARCWWRGYRQHVVERDD
jgi:hypothetical protein